MVKQIPDKVKIDPQEIMLAQHSEHSVGEVYALVGIMTEKLVQIGKQTIDNLHNNNFTNY